MRISDWSSDVCSSDLEICGRCGKAPNSGERADLGYLDFDDLLHRRSLSRKLRSSEPDRPTQETEQRKNDDGQPPASPNRQNPAKQAVAAIQNRYDDQRPEDEKNRLSEQHQKDKVKRKAKTTS